MTAESRSDNVAAEGEVLCITGGPRSGKTTALVERACAWRSVRSPYETGATAPCHSHGETQDAGSSLLPQDDTVRLTPWAAPSFLFFCASPVFIGAAEALLAKHGATGGLVTTPFDYALHILAHPRARAATGRSPRVLTADEQAVFFEDLKTSGLKRGRLRELWAFLLCGLASLDDDDPAWIQTTEERAQLELAQDILHFEGAMLPGEVVNLAVRALEADAALRDAFAVPVVLADDFPLMSRASQRLVELLAKEKLAVAGDPTPLPPAFEPYPNPCGMDELRGRHRPVQVVALDEPFPTATREWQAEETLSDEMRLVAAVVAEELARGTSPASIAVVATNPLWRANLVRALEMAGVPAAEYRAPALPLPGERKGSGGNRPANSAKVAGASTIDALGSRQEAQQGTERDADRSRILRALAADPSDSVAWRQWLAQGDALARSAAVGELRQAAATEDLILAEALPRLAANQLPDLPATSPFAHSLLDSYEEALRLLSEVGAVKKSINLDMETTSSPAVTVCTPRDLVGRTFDVVIFGGFVNGFIPTREMCDPGVVVGAARQRALTADRAVLNAVTTRATRHVLFTGFSTCDLETAEHLGLHIARIRLRDGHRQCTIEPSVYLEELGLS